MGTTLQNGVYLPNEGERNCYAGLKTNWEILDQKVADVTALQQAVAGALHREIVESLPTTDIDPNTIYMILSGTSATENVYNEFMYVNNAWELIGTSATDLTNYYTKGEVDGLLLLKANVSDLTSHTGDTTIHVTTADKTKWNNGVSQSYVLRYSSSSVTDNSTIAYSTLDNTDNIKASDKIIDSDGKIFSVVSVDTANQTVTVGTALIDLAQDSDIVHKSGNETVGGVKTFSNNTYITSLNFTSEVASQSSSSSAILPIITTVTYTDSSPSQSARLNLRITASGDKSLYPYENNQYALGLTSRKWSEIHATTYYYGSSDVEFSNKFVTTDTSQSSISGTKVWVGRQDWAVNCCRVISNAFEKGEIPSSDTNRNDYYILKNGSTSYASAVGVLGGGVSSTNVVTMRLQAMKNVSNSISKASIAIKYNSTTDEKTLETNGDFLPTDNASQNIGNSTSKWATFNGLEPSSLSLPDLSNGIDISSYFDMSLYTGQTYTPIANGWISISITSPNRSSLLCESTGLSQTAYGVTDPDDNTKYRVSILIPCQKNQTLTTYIRASGGTINFAKFYPCQGNV